MQERKELVGPRAQLVLLLLCLGLATRNLCSGTGIECVDSTQGYRWLDLDTLGPAQSKNELSYLLLLGLVNSAPEGGDL